MQDRQIKGADVTVGTGLTELLHLKMPELADGTVLCVEVQNAGATAFNAFNVEVRMHPRGSWFALHDAGADYTSPLPTNGIVQRCSVDADPDADGLFTLPGGSQGWFSALIYDVAEVRIRASVAAGSTTARALAVVK